MALPSAVSLPIPDPVLFPSSSLSEDGRGPPRRGDRYDDRRGPAGGNWRRRDDDYYRYGGGGRYDSYNDRRDYGGRDYGRGGDYRRDYGGRDYRRDSRDDYGYRGGGGVGGPDRYGDRYSRDDRREDRRGGGGGGGDDAAPAPRSYYDRDANPPSYDAGPPREPRDAYASRSYEGRGEDRYGSSR